MTDHEDTNTAIRRKIRELLAATSCRLPSNAEWLEHLVAVRAAWRAVRIDAFGDFEGIGAEDLEAALEQLSSSARVLDTFAAMCEAAHALLADAVA